MLTSVPFPCAWYVRACRPNVAALNICPAFWKTTSSVGVSGQEARQLATLVHEMTHGLVSGWVCLGLRWGGGGASVMLPLLLGCVW